MHNTKIVSPKANEDKELANNKYAKHTRGRAIRLMEMYQMMFKSAEVYTNMVFENIPTMPLQLYAGIDRTI